MAGTRFHSALDLPEVRRRHALPVALADQETPLRRVLPVALADRESLLPHALHLVRADREAPLRLFRPAGLAGQQFLSRFGR
jgi:hypothetical protein